MKSKIIKEYLEKELEVSPFSPGSESMQKLSEALDLRQARRKMRRFLVITTPAVLLTSVFLFSLDEAIDRKTESIVVKEAETSVIQDADSKFKGSTANDDLRLPYTEPASESGAAREVLNDLTESGNTAEYSPTEGKSPLAISARETEKNITANDLLLSDTPLIQNMTSGIAEPMENAELQPQSGEIASEAGMMEASPEILSEEELKNILPRLSAIAFAGPQWSLPSYSGETAGLPKSEGLISVNAGLNLSYRLGKGIHIQSGLNYHCIADRIYVSGSSDSVMEVTDNGFWDVTDSWKTIYTDSVWDNRNPGGWIYTDSMVVPFKDSVYRADYDTSFNISSTPSGSYERKIGQVEIPLLLYFEKTWKKFSLGIMAGAGIGYTVYSRGYMISSDGRSEQISPGEITRRWNYSMIGGLCLDYRFAPSWSAGLQPMFRTTVNPLVELGEAGISYASYSLNLRLRYFFSLPKAGPR